MKRRPESWRGWAQITKAHTQMGRKVQAGRLIRVGLARGSLSQWNGDAEIVPVEIRRLKKARRRHA